MAKLAGWACFHPLASATLVLVLIRATKTHVLTGQPGHGYPLPARFAKTGRSGNQRRIWPRAAQNPQM